jgi:hypothetical protein
MGCGQRIREGKGERIPEGSVLVQLLRAAVLGYLLTAASVAEVFANATLRVPHITPYLYLRSSQRCDKRCVLRRGWTTVQAPRPHRTSWHL